MGLKNDVQVFISLYSPYNAEYSLRQNLIWYYLPFSKKLQ